MNLAEAEKIGNEFVELLSPYCKVCEIAGSVRRRKSTDIKDIEICCIPDGVKLDQYFILDRIKKYENQEFTYVKNGNKYKQLIWKGRKIDLFICRDESYFGMLFLIRTGSAKFSEFILSQWKKLTGGYCKENILYDKAGNAYPCATEEEVFKKINLYFIEPTNRNY